MTPADAPVAACEPKLAPREPKGVIWAVPCPRCLQEAKGCVRSLYTQEGLKAHVFQVHGEVET